MMEICSICLDPALIPVEPICFGCNSNAEMSCFSMKRVCFLCAENYLDLSNPKYCRSIKKCIYCPLTVNLQKFTKNECFRVDYWMMGQDTEKKTCPSCPFEGSHIEIARHFIQSCPKFNVECECGMVCKREDISQHQKECIKYKLCVLCMENVLDTDMPRHMYYQHDKTKCFTCHQYISMPDLTNHILAECPERLVSCHVCSGYVKQRSIKKHLKEHLTKVRKSIKTMKQKLGEEKNSQTKIQNLILRTSS